MVAPRLRSHRQALVAAVLVLGVAACGSDDDSASPASSSPGTVTAPSATAPADTEPAGGPPVIRIGEASGGVAPESAAAGDAVASNADAPTKMMAAGIEFVFVGAAGEDLSGPAPAWYFADEGLPSIEDVQALAAQFGLEGEVVEVGEDRGGGLAVGSLDDYSAPTLMVAPDAMRSWWYNAGDTAMEQPVCEPVKVTDGSETEEVVCEPLPPPANVPTKEQAEAKARDLLSRLGLDASSYELETYADEWSASVNALLLIDGVRTNTAMYMSYGAEGVLTWAGGFLATPQRGEEYPRIGVPAAIERLNEPNWMFGGQNREVVDIGTDTDAAATAEGDAPRADSTGAPATAVDATERGDVPAVTLVVPADPMVDPAVCDPAADCVPADVEPIVVQLSNPRPSLEQLWADDGTVWLLPGYAFDGDDSGTYTVIAVDASYLEGPEQPATDPTVDTLPTDDTATPDTVAPDSVVPSDDSTVPADSSVPADTTAATPDPAAFVGQTVEAATPMAAEAGVELRVVREDGVDLVVTEDFRENRLNVAVEDGVITELVSIG